MAWGPDPSHPLPSRERGGTHAKHGEGEGECKNLEPHGFLHSPSPFPPLCGGPLPSPGTGEGLLAGFVVIAGLIFAQPANAQSEAPKDTLKRVEQQLQTDKQRQQQLERQSQALQSELDDLRGRLIALADQARGQEQELDQLEESLTALEVEERERSAGLDAERQQIATLLAALQRLARIPPEAALARPESPVDTLRSALLLRDAVPALKARADALAQALTALADTRGRLVDQRSKALAARVALAEKQGEMNRLIARREELSRQTEEERVQVGQRMAALSGQATDLRQLMERIEAERRAAIEAAARREAERREAERKLAELRATEQKIAERKAAEEKRARDEAAREAARERELAAKAPEGRPAVAGMVLPAAGKLTTRFGEADRYGATSRGVTVQTRAGAAVVAPRGGTIVFAGPFKGYGLILIVEHGNGYHSLIAGLGRIDTAVGRKVAGGEPLAVMPPDGNPDLYFELRRNGQPINPQRGFGAPEGKGQG